jgi:hypothetical protein
MEGQKKALTNNPLLTPKARGDQARPLLMMLDLHTTILADDAG